MLSHMLKRHNVSLKNISLFSRPNLRIIITWYFQLVGLNLSRYRVRIHDTLTNMSWFVLVGNIDSLSICRLDLICESRFSIFDIFL